MDIFILFSQDLVDQKPSERDLDDYYDKFDIAVTKVCFCLFVVIVVIVVEHATNTFNIQDACAVGAAQCDMVASE